MTFSCCKLILSLQTCLPILQVQTLHSLHLRGCNSGIVASTTNSRPTRDTLDEGSSIQGHNEVFVNKRIQYLPSPERTREKTRGGHRRESRSCVSLQLDVMLAEELDTGVFSSLAIGQCLHTHCASWASD